MYFYHTFFVYICIKEVKINFAKPHCDQMTEENSTKERHEGL